MTNIGKIVTPPAPPSYYEAVATLQEGWNLRVRTKADVIVLDIGGARGHMSPAEVDTLIKMLEEAKQFNEKGEIGDRPQGNA